MSNKAELIIIIQNWLNLESQIKEASTALRELRKQKKLVSSELIKTMKDNEITQIDVKKGQIQYSKRKSRSALNKKMLESALADFFKESGDHTLPSELASFIMDKRTVKEIDTVKIKTNG